MNDAHKQRTLFVKLLPRRPAFSKYLYFDPPQAAHRNVAIPIKTGHVCVRARVQRQLMIASLFCCSCQFKAFRSMTRSEIQRAIGKAGTAENIQVAPPDCAGTLNLAFLVYSDSSLGSYYDLNRISTLHYHHLVSCKAVLLGGNLNRQFNTYGTVTRECERAFQKLLAKHLEFSEATVPRACYIVCQVGYSQMSGFMQAYTLYRSSCIARLGLSSTEIRLDALRLKFYSV